jgi:hypothetical protein
VCFFLTFGARCGRYGKAHKIVLRKEVLGNGGLASAAWSGKNEKAFGCVSHDSFSV